MGLEKNCEICNRIIVMGCVVTNQNRNSFREEICKSCSKAIKDAREQIIYLKSLKNKI